MAHIWEPVVVLRYQVAAKVISEIKAITMSRVVPDDSGGSGLFI